MSNWTPADLAMLLKRITYKPGYKLCVMQPHNSHGYVLHIETMVEDAYRRKPGKEEIHMVFTIPPILDGEKHALFLIHNALIEFERHEVNEWFELDGIKIFDPHKEDKQ